MFYQILKPLSKFFKFFFDFRFMKRTKPYAIRAIVEHGRREFLSLAAVKMPYVSEKTKCLSVPGFGNLNLVGRLDKEGVFHGGNRNGEGQISLSFYIEKLKPRVIIFEDGRVYYNDCLEEVIGKDLPALEYFLRETFAKRQFTHRFENLYEKYKKSNEN